ncbi:MAG TPA: pitrilysin family protein, partial [Thermoanaerobaculia bacterium]
MRSQVETLEAPPGLKSLPGRLELERLGNGLTVCLLENPQAPVVTSALFYRAGTRDEAPGHGGTAHFLEHMMFKGAARFGPGEIDRLTQALGGVNNAFTSHDSTAYYFNFAADRWTEALAIEADRMSSLALDPEQVASERQVILEEIAMYDSEPWDALEMAVHERLFPG